MKSKSRANSMDKIINNRIRLLRLANRISQNNLAKNLNISTQQVAKYEKGTNRVAASRLLMIANLFKVDISYFYRSEDFPELDLNGNKFKKGNVLSELGLHEIGLNFIKLNPSQQKGISQLVRTLATE